MTSLEHPSLMRKLLALVREVAPHYPNACAGGGGVCPHRVTWIYPYLNGGRQSFYCDEHLPPSYRDVAEIPHAELHRVLDQLDMIDAPPSTAKTAWQRLAEIDEP